MKTLSPEIVAVAEWLEAVKKTNKYGKASVSITLHNGEVSLIEKGVTEKVKPGATDGR